MRPVAAIPPKTSTIRSYPVGGIDCNRNAPRLRWLAAANASGRSRMTPSVVPADESTAHLVADDFGALDAPDARPTLRPQISKPSFGICSPMNAGGMLRRRGSA